MQSVCSPYNNNNKFPCAAYEDRSVDIVYLLFRRLAHLQQEMAITVVCLKAGDTKQRSQPKDQKGEMILMGNRGNKGWDMGSRLNLRHKVWNWMGRGGRRWSEAGIWRQTWGFES